MSFRPHAFGRYTILDPVAVGGMAEIYRARLTNSGDGPDRILIIKKVIQSLSQNDEFVHMFEEEIKITVGLSHPNIVQIYDYGRVDGVSFLAMEYVEGKNLRQFLKRLISMKSMFSIDMSCYIVSQVTNALGYAHSFRDRMTGEHLGIVHRDVSPQNILISYDGAVKLFDFGIAKAKSASEATQAGVIKGKPSYLSPEQIAGEVLDGRSDIFSMGIVLWEMLTAKRLFVADNDMAILRMIQSAKIEPPSTYNPAIPQALDAIVLRSLARDRNKRYRTGEEFQRDLHRFLYSYNPAFNPADLSYYATELFKKEIQEDRERLRAALKMTPDPGPPGAKPAKQPSNDPATAASESMTEGLLTSNDFNREVMEDMLATRTSQQGDGKGLDITKKNKLKKKAPKAPPPPGAGPTSATKRQGGEDLVIPPWMNQEGTRQTATGINDAVVQRKLKRTGSASAALTNQVSRNYSGNKMVMIAGGGFLAIFIALVMGTYVSPGSTCGMVSIFAESPLEGLFNCGRRIANDPNAACSENPTDPSCGTVCVGAKESPACKSFCSANPRAAICLAEDPSDPVTNPPGDEKLYAPVTIQTNVTDFEVTLNGLRALVKAGNVISVRIGESIVLRLRKPGYDMVERTLNLESAQPVSVKVPMKKTETGYLTFLTNPGADITLRTKGRRPLSLYTPLKKYRLAVGKYEVEIENATIGHKSTMTISIEKDQLTEIEKDL